MWSDERAELLKSIKQSVIWAIWYITAWVALMVPVAKAMIQ